MASVSWAGSWLEKLAIVAAAMCTHRWEDTCIRPCVVRLVEQILKRGDRRRGALHLPASAGLTKLINCRARALGVPTPVVPIDTKQAEGVHGVAARKWEVVGGDGAVCVYIDEHLRGAEHVSCSCDAHAHVANLVQARVHMAQTGFPPSSMTQSRVRSATRR